MDAIMLRFGVIVALMCLVRAVAPDCPKLVESSEDPVRLWTDKGTEGVAMLFAYNGGNTTITQCQQFDSDGTKCTESITIQARIAKRCDAVETDEGLEPDEVGIALSNPFEWFSNISIPHSPAFHTINKTESALELHFGMNAENALNDKFVNLVLVFPLGSESSEVESFIEDAKANKLDFSEVIDVDKGKMYHAASTDIPGGNCGRKYDWYWIESKFTVSKEQAQELTKATKSSLNICESRKALIPADNTAVRNGSPKATTAPKRPTDAPSPSEDAPVPTGTTEPTCFPETAKVQLESGHQIPISQLNIGDRVVVRNGHISPVFLFSHRDPHAVTYHVKLALESGKSLTLSPGHFVYANQAMKPARDVLVGDSLQNNKGESEIVKRSTLVEARGLYNPQTISGDIVVDGVLCSTYTEAIERPAAHAMLAPLRSMFRMGGITEYTAGRFLAHGSQVW